MTHKVRVVEERSLSVEIGVKRRLATPSLKATRTQIVTNTFNYDLDSPAHFFGDPNR